MIKIKTEFMTRVRDVDVANKLNEQFRKSGLKSFNEFINQEKRRRNKCTSLGKRRKSRMAHCDSFENNSSRGERDSETATISYFSGRKNGLETSCANLD